MLMLMRKQLFLLLTVLIAGSCVLGAPKKTPAKKPLPVWKPAPALLKQLAEPTEFAFGSIRMPRGYVVIDMNSFDTAGTGIAWAKKSSRQKNDNMFVILQLPIEAIDQKNITLESALDSLYANPKRFKIQKRRSTAVRGIVNGNRAIKADWFGTNRQTGAKVQGTTLVIINDTDVYAIISHYRNDQVVERRLTDAAMYTFKIQN